ncbi:glycosyltransferase [Idiomarina sp. UBA3162]|uniref:glycosyltransferase n=1 Tax=Idiomarina sp. UBA3162 TaxID=1946641 RepID=UPI000C8AFD5A|nr:glycosyltransferase [Idiomarina sp. UBA3162]MAD52445.1 hypothetical protein [Idiomarinaceae bacterium]
MKKKIFYLIRYSVLQDSKQWKIARDNDYEQYKRALFGDERLALKYKLFSQLTLPSVVAQQRPDEADNYEVILLTSKDLPTDRLNQLEQLAKKHPCLTILAVDPNRSFVSVASNYLKQQFDRASEDCVYSTVRLDDDDILHRRFERRLRFYTAKINLNYMVTFSQGYEAFLDKQRQYELSQAIELYYPKIALGLAQVGFYSAEKNSVIGKNIHVYQTGKHTTVNQRYNLIEDTTPHMFVRVSYDLQDTQAEGFLKRVKSAECTDIKVLIEQFPELV